MRFFSSTLVLVATAAALAIATAVVATGQEVPDLAERCNAVKWAQDELDTPADLRKISDDLRAQGRPALEQIAGALPKSANLRRIAPALLSDWPCDRTRELLVALLDDRSRRATEAAASALGDVGGKEVVEPLLEAARTGHGMLRHNALIALSQMGRANAAHKIALKALRDKQPWVRHCAVQLLEDVDAGAHLATVTEAIDRAAREDTDPVARAAAVRALGILRARAR